MTFLPIVDRELRVAARKRSTFWLRVVAALVAMIIGSALMLLTQCRRFRHGDPGSRSVWYPDLPSARGRLVGGPVLYLGLPERGKA